MEMLIDVTKDDKDMCLGLFSALDNIEQIGEMLDYLKKNYNNNALMNIDNLIEETHRIRGYEYQ